MIQTMKLAKCVACFSRTIFRLGVLLSLLLSAHSVATPRWDSQGAAAAFKLAREKRTEIAATAGPTLDQYLECARTYRKVHVKDPHYGRTGDAIYEEALIYQEAAEKFRKPEYFRTAVTKLRLLLKDYGGNANCPDALVRMGSIYSKHLDDPAAADESYHALQKRYRYSAEAIKRLRSEPVPAVSQSETAPKPEKKEPAQLPHPSAASSGPLSTVQSIRFWSTNDYTRVLIDMDAEAKYAKEQLRNPDRVYFDIANARISRDLNRDIKLTDGIVKQIRVASNRAHVVRIVLDTTETGDFVVSEMHDPFRIVVDLRRKGLSPPAAAAVKSQPAPPKPPETSPPHPTQPPMAITELKTAPAKESSMPKPAEATGRAKENPMNPEASAARSSKVAPPGNDDTAQAKKPAEKTGPSAPEAAARTTPSAPKTAPVSVGAASAAALEAKASNKKIETQEKHSQPAETPAAGLTAKQQQPLTVTDIPSLPAPAARSPKVAPSGNDDTAQAKKPAEKTGPSTPEAAARTTPSAPKTAPVSIGAASTAALEAKASSGKIEAKEKRSQSAEVLPAVAEAKPQKPPVSPGVSTNPAPAGKPSKSQAPAAGEVEASQSNKSTEKAGEPVLTATLRTAGPKAGAADGLKPPINEAKAPARKSESLAKGAGLKEPSPSKPDLLPLPKQAEPTSKGDRTLTRILGLKVGRIVIDPGHGGHDQGTIGPGGLLEKDLVLSIAKSLRKMIEDRLGAEVFLTREDDTFIPLEDRTAIANQHKADLFVSIHANSSKIPSISGVETYYLDFAKTDAEREIAARENATTDNNVRDLEDLIKKIAQAEKSSESRELASIVQKRLYSGARQVLPSSHNRGVRSAPFIVLIGANMPSVLAEVSFISNPRDERLLKKDSTRQTLVKALFSGIDGYMKTLGSDVVRNQTASQSR